MKQIIAVSKAFYRGTWIWETKDGFSVLLGEKEYDFISLVEATLFIDTCYASIIDVECGLKAA
jgi:hypothetical protein